MNPSTLMSTKMLFSQGCEKQWYALKEKKLRCRAKGNLPQVCFKKNSLTHPVANPVHDALLLNISSLHLFQMKWDLMHNVNVEFVHQFQVQMFAY